MTAAIEVERVSFQAAVVLLLSASEELGLPFPYSIEDSGHRGDMLVINFYSIADLEAWSVFFGLISGNTWEQNGDLNHTAYAHSWQGWYLNAFGADPLVSATELPAREPGATLVADPAPVEIEGVHFTEPAVPAGQCGGPTCDADASEPCLFVGQPDDCSVLDTDPERFRRVAS